MSQCNPKCGGRVTCSVARGKIAEFSHKQGINYLNTPFILMTTLFSPSVVIMKSLTPHFLADLRFDSAQLANMRAVGEFRGRQELFFRQAPEVLRGLLEVAKIESSESSNRLEGVTVPRDRLRRLVVNLAQPRNRSEQEVAGYRDALAMMHSSAREMTFTSNIMLQIHGILYRYMPNPGGRWKPTDNDIVERLSKWGDSRTFQACSGTSHVTGRGAAFISIFRCYTDTADGLIDRDTARDFGFSLYTSVRRWQRSTSATADVDVVVSLGLRGGAIYQY